MDAGLDPGSTSAEWRRPLRIQILVLFLCVFGTMAVVLSVVAGKSTRELVDHAVEAAFVGTAELALQELDRLQTTAQAAADALAAHPMVQSATAAERAAGIDTLAVLLRSVPGISAAYVGWPDGDFLLLRPIGTHGPRLNAPEGAMWLAQWSDASGSRFEFLEDDLTSIVQRDALEHEFDPRLRPWFVEATTTTDTIVTAPYVFFTTREPGLTAARRSVGGAVAGVDLSLWDLSNRLPAGQPVPSAEAAILDLAGGVLAASDVDRLGELVAAGVSPVPSPAAEPLPAAVDLDSPIIAALAARLQATPRRFTGEVAASDRDWLATIVPLGTQGLAFVMAGPVDEIAVGPQAVRTRLLQSFAVILLLTAPLVWLAARLLARPVETFVQEVERVARFDFGAVPPVRTRVSELAELDAAIATMRASLQHFTGACRTVVEADDGNTLLAGVLDALLAAGAADRGGVWLVDDDGALRPVVQRGGAPAAATAASLAAPDFGPLREVELRDIAADTPTLGSLAAAGGRLSVLVVPLDAPTGRRFGLLAIARPERPFDPQVLALGRFVAHWLGLALDRSRLAADLAAAHREAELVLGAVADGIRVLGVDGRIRRQNPAARAMLGQDDPEAVGADAHDLVHHHRADGSPYPVEDCPVCHTLRDGQPRWVEDEVYFRADGSSFPVSYACAALRDAKGNITGAVVSFRDVSERIRARNALQRRMAELGCLYRVLELTSDPTRAVDEILHGVTAVLATALGTEHPAFVRLTVGSDVFTSEARLPTTPLLRAEIGLYGRTVGALELEDHPALPGEPPPADATAPAARAMLDAVAAHVANLLEGRALTAQLAQSERLRAIGELTGGIAHDFNNRLTVILGNAELLADGLSGEPRLLRLATMTRQAAEGAAELTRRLLAFARRQPLRPQVTAIGGLVAEMDALLGWTLGKTVTVESRSSDDLWPALVDPAQLEDALLNLALNARDAMPDGGTLTIACRNVRLEPGHPDWTDDVVAADYVLIELADDGMGMAPEVAARAFEPFFTTKEVGRGSGLGLSMVYGFAKQSGGHVRLVSVAGQGTVIRLYLPRATRLVAPTLTPTPPPMPRGHETILLVEDDHLLRDHVTNLLQSLGYAVLGVDDAAAAAAALARDVRVDLVLGDVAGAGGRGGAALAEAVQRVRPGLPMLFTSGGDARARTAGWGLPSDVTVLAKPFRQAELAARLREALATAASADEAS